ncbi:hypothetical protein CDAR_448241 [Caerostris darwini]|uniref:Uncharacterized protein n=1 Tax=Caerostris darwini TaxID=1538125 RepID=A0AAV4SGI3_9ARAC|nr:hypothetical protein CDAR_448241 [Caerostris darwini]
MPEIFTKPSRCSPYSSGKFNGALNTFHSPIHSISVPAFDGWFPRPWIRTGRCEIGCPKKGAASSFGRGGGEKEKRDSWRGTLLCPLVYHGSR